MKRAVFITNILIDYLNGVEEARTELDLYQEALISTITQIEVLVGAQTLEEEAAVRSFLVSRSRRRKRGSQSAAYSHSMLAGGLEEMS